MKQFSNSSDISNYLLELKKKGLSIGFVPTMGALHKGHIALIEKAKKENQIVICSIFVNPLQFNRAADLKSYPNRIKEDTELLDQADCDVLYLPTKEDIYPNKPSLTFDFGSIAKNMEAEHRPNHFEGVAAVINRFLEILHPDQAYFGEKDYQQLAIIKWLAKNKNFNTKIIGCETVRHNNGLAMSSRNFLLEDSKFETASKIYQCLLYCKENKFNFSPADLSKKCLKILDQDFEPEYFIIADENSMEPIKNWEDSKFPRAFVAAYLSTVRLIDNLSLNN